MVGKLYPSRATVAIPCDVKGLDSYAVHRLCEFWRACGLSNFEFMCDQETSLGACIIKAMQQMELTGQHVNAIPEHSAIGESQNNGRAEAPVRGVRT